jgi:hypothetical protein
MSRSLVLVASLAVGACASEVNDPPPPPATCQISDRLGTYLFTYAEISGDCGTIEPAVVSLNPGPGGAGKGCVLNSERITENNCKIERDLSCQTPTGSIRTVGVTRQQTQDGSVLTGTASFTLTGRPSCSGTYSLRAVRQ